MGCVYVCNNSPWLKFKTLAIAGQPTPVTSVPPGAHSTFTVTWSSDSAEDYVFFDPVTDALTQRRETLKVSWFATNGIFTASDTVSAPGDEPGRSSNG